MADHSINPLSWVAQTTRRTTTFYVVCVLLLAFLTGWVTRVGPALPAERDIFNEVAGVLHEGYAANFPRLAEHVAQVTHSLFLSGSDVDRALDIYFEEVRPLSKPDTKI